MTQRVHHMVRTAMTKQHSPQDGLELSLSGSLMCFVKEQMRFLNLPNVADYVARLISEEKARKALQEHVRLEQLEIRELSALRRRRWNNRLESTN
jgi:hypothetical protein